LSTYRWSSHLDYTGKKNFPSVLHMNFLSKSFGGSERYAKDMKKYLTLMHKKNNDEFASIELDD